MNITKVKQLVDLLTGSKKILEVTIDDKIYYVYTIYHEQFYFCNDYDCWTNFKENYRVFRVDEKINNYNYKIASD